jgi:WD40 repeat protein
MRSFRSFAVPTSLVIAAACGGTEPSNAPPVAAFTASCTKLACVFQNASTDDDGSIARYAWAFGDGATSSDASPSHSFSASGHFMVTLAVIDNAGATAKLSQKLAVSADSLPPARDSVPPAGDSLPPVGGNHPPVAVFGVACGALTCTFTNRSADPDAADSITVSWAFGDGATSAEWNPSHTYDAPGGSFFIPTLTVTDSRNASAIVADTLYLAPDGPPPVAGQIAFSRDGKIFLANTDGTGLVQLTAGPADINPAWSPDGSRIAFYRGGNDGGIYVMGADGGSQVRRTSPGGSPTWSPDGHWIAFACLVGGGGGICKVPADGDAATPVIVLARTGYVDFPAWSPDGSRIAFTSDYMMYDFVYDTWILTLDGAEPALLPRSRELWPHCNEVQAAWSADGQRMAASAVCAYDGVDLSRIVVRNRDGSGLTGVTMATGYAHPTWSPDGRFIAFASENSIEWVSVDGSRRGRIIANGMSPAWRP